MLFRSEGNPYGMQDGNNVAPEDWISCTGPLSGNNTWKNLDTIISVGNTGKYFLAFFWKNNSSAGTQPPAAIDNVNFFEEVCPQVQNMATSNITTTSATISWTGNIYKLARLIMRRKMKNFKNINEKNSIQYLLEFAKPCKKLLISSVILAVLGAAVGIIPYLAVSKAIIQI